jgi:parallel beta-helix repeat protein
LKYSVFIRHLKGDRKGNAMKSQFNFLFLISWIMAFWIVDDANADTALNSSNWLGTQGAHYWIISEPGYYYLDIAESVFYTTHNFAIRLNTSNIILDGKGRTITGPEPSSVVESLEEPNIYGVRANAGLPSSGIEVRNLIVNNKYFGVIYEGVSEGLIETVNASRNQFGIYIWNGDYNKISGNITNKNFHTGIVFDADCGNNINPNNDCMNSHNTVNNNTANENGEFGIFLWLDCPDSDISENTVKFNGNTGLSVSEGSTGCSIKGNTSQANTGGGLLVNSDNNEIVDNILMDNTNTGLGLNYANGNIVKDNQCTGNNTGGMWLTSASENAITDNTCDTNSGHGIVLTSGSSNNDLTGNSADENGQVGILFLSQSNYNTVTWHSASNNSTGIKVINSECNNITISSFNANRGYGAILDSSSGNNISGSNIIGNQNVGICLAKSFGNTVSDNTVTNNSYFGAYLNSSSENMIYNNIFNNPSKNVGFTGVNNNSWNASKTSETNIVGGPFMGGNFWGKPDGTGFSQTTADGDLDGLCDSVYTITSGNVDQLPLHEYSQVTDLFVNPNDPNCGGNAPCFLSIQDALNAVRSGNTIKLVQGIYNGENTLTEDKAVTIQGGWSTSFEKQTGKTILRQAPKAPLGSLRLKEITIKP